VVVSGAPGSGKTTVARVLSRQLELPLLSKDTIKEALLDVMGAASVEASKELGRAAIAVLLALANDTHGAVLESVWRRSLATRELTTLDGRIVEVHCRCPADVARARYSGRAGRAAGHFDRERLEEDLWHGEAAEPIASGWRVVEVDTTAPIHEDHLVDEVTRRLATDCPDSLMS
jgi:predicted kinase